MYLEPEEIEWRLTGGTEEEEKKKKKKKKKGKKPKKEKGRCEKGIEVD